MSDEEDLTRPEELDPAIAGSIVPGEDESPPWKVVRHDYEIRSIGVPNVRPCNHRSFVVDPKFRTVTCRDCHERIDPVAAMLVIVNWYEHLEHKRQAAVMAERSLAIARLQALRRLKINTPQHLTELTLLYRNASTMRPSEIWTVLHRIESEHRSIREAKRQQRAKVRPIRRPKVYT